MTLVAFRLTRASKMFLLLVLLSCPLTFFPTSAIANGPAKVDSMLTLKKNGIKYGCYLRDEQTWVAGEISKRKFNPFANKARKLKKKIKNSTGRRREEYKLNLRKLTKLEAQIHRQCAKKKNVQDALGVDRNGMDTMVLRASDQCVINGDIDGDGAIDVDDVNCVNNAYTHGIPACPLGDVYPCGGDGRIDVDDVLAIIAAYENAGECNSSNSAPQSIPGSYAPVNLGQAVQFNGSASSDPGGFIESYNWSFGDGNSGTGQTLNHTYASPGVYAVTLTVTDNCGAARSAITSATVHQPSNGTLNPKLVGIVAGEMGTPNGYAHSPDGRTLYVASSEMGVIEFDITSRNSPVFRGRSKQFNQAKFVATNGTYLAIGTDLDYLKVTSVATHGTDAESWRLYSDVVARGLKISGNKLVVAAGFTGLKIIDLSNLDAPIATVAVNNARGVAISPNGRYAFVAGGAGENGGLRVVDLQLNPPAQIAHLPHPPSGNTSDVVLNDTGTVAFTAEYGAGVSAINIQNPLSPQRTVTIDAAHGPIYGLSVSGNLLFTHRGLSTLSTRVYNASNSNLSLRSSASPGLGIPKALFSHAIGDTYYGGGGSSNGFQVYDISPIRENPPRDAVQTANFPAEVGQRLGLCTASNGQLALVGGSGFATSVINVSDPANPVEVSRLNTNARKIVLKGHLAYIASGPGGLKIYNLATPSNPVHVTTATDESGSTFNAASVAISTDGRWAYVASTTAGLRVLDLNNPSSPVLRTTFDTPGSAYGVTLNSAGTIAYVADNSAGLRMINVSNPLNPSFIGAFEKPEDGPASLVNLLEYNGLKLAIVSWSLASPHWKIIDVSNPTSPVIRSTRLGFGEVGIYERYMIQPPYTFNSKVRIVDLSNPAQPAEAFVVNVPGNSGAVTVVNGIAYTAENAALLAVIDLVP